ncbi:MAG: hypothetical protein ACREP5_02560 [Candidatus Binatia bacterium]
MTNAAPIKRTTLLLLFLIVIPAFLWSQSEPDKFDVLIMDGTVYDGTGAESVQADVGIKGDRRIPGYSP